VEAERGARVRVVAPRILQFADPGVKALFPFALLACVVDGAVMPLQGWVLSEVEMTWHIRIWYINY
jgi:hypothetical protein